MHVLQTLKFVALSDPEIIGVLKKFGQSLDTPTLEFLQHFEWASVRMDPVNVGLPAKFEVRRDNSDCSFGCCEPQSWRREAVGVCVGTVGKRAGEFP